ncbi:hypothetical protein ACU639_35920 [Streptomyces cynarae]|uniref:hypothetical protein n=1 Tax=Streptomyces cynarae TaxID=2981134 RepID=UPI00406D044D
MPSVTAGRGPQPKSTLRFDSAHGRRGRIVKDVRLSGDLSGEQVERLPVIADRCPVNRIVSNPLASQTTLGA